MKPSVRNIVLRKYILLALAALLYILSFPFNKIYTNRSSVSREVRLAEKYLHRQQNDFTDFVKDTALLGRLLNNEETLDELSDFD